MGHPVKMRSVFIMNGFEIPLRVFPTKLVCPREESSSLTFEPRANHQISNFPPPWKLTFHQQHCTLLGRKSGSPDQKFFSLGLSSTCQGLDKGVRFSSHYFFDHWTKFRVSLSRVAKLEITLSHITNLYPESEDFENFDSCCIQLWINFYFFT